MNFRQVHLDFHTSEKIEGIGEKFDKKQFQEALKAGYVNSITVFSKCHHGWAYHPSKANEMHPNLKFDLLGAQIEAAHEIGVKTPVYISAGFDEKAAHEHPDWIGEDESGAGRDFSKPMYHRMCMNTPYLDYLLGQIKEVCENYDADGIFLDIVNVFPCFCPSCLKSMFEKGYDPCNEEDVIRLAEEVYANYLKRTREVIYSVKPGLPLFHNGGHIRQGRRDLAYANSHLELESLPTGGWGYDHFPFSARYVQNLDREYLGMTGKFHLSWGEFGGFKHPNALKYEAALSIALGAKCSVGDQLAPNGKMDMTTYKLLGEAYRDVAEKEEWLDGTEPVCDVAVFSNEASDSANNLMKGTGGLKKSDIGAGRILLEGKYQFSVVDFETDWNKYKVLVLPDNIQVNTEIKNKINDFLKNGGKLLASGKSAIGENGFIFDFGAKYAGENEYCPDYIRPYFDNEYETDYVMYSKGIKTEKTTGSELAARIDPYFNRTREHFCSHQHAPSSSKYGGSGMIEGKDGIYIAWNIFEDYAEKGEIISKKCVCFALDRLLGKDKLLATDLGSMGVASLRKQNDRYILHMLYAIPTKRGNGVEIIEDAYPVYNTKISVKLEKKIKKVYLAPQNEELEFSINDGRVEAVIPKIDIHQMVVFE